MSLLTICRGAAVQLGIASPASLIGNDNPDAMLLLEMANKEGYLLANRAYWNVIRKEHSFTTVATASQGSASMPDDFETVVDETIFNRTMRRRMTGPVTPQEWSEIQAGLVTAVNPSFYIRGGVMLISPTPSEGQTVAFEYLSKNWARSAASAEQDSFLDDTDTTVFPEVIVTQGIIWRYRAHKGYEFENARLEYERMVADRMMRDGVKPRLVTQNVTSPSENGRVGRAFVQDWNTIPT
jgi:hypothetical protein